MNIQDFTTRLLAHMGLETVEVGIEETEEMISVQLNVSEEDSGLLIGYHGESLAAIQKILQHVFSRGEEAKKIVVNVNDYKQRRAEQLTEMASRAAYQVLETGERYLFPYLPANERLVIHQVISSDPEFATLESVSEGEGLQRRLQLRVRQK